MVQHARCQGVRVGVESAWCGVLVDRGNCARLVDSFEVRTKKCECNYFDTKYDGVESESSLEGRCCGRTSVGDVRPMTKMSGECAVRRPERTWRKEDKRVVGKESTFSGLSIQSLPEHLLACAARSVANYIHTSRHPFSGKTTLQRSPALSFPSLHSTHKGSTFLRNGVA